MNGTISRLAGLGCLAGALLFLAGCLELNGKVSAHGHEPAGPPQLYYTQVEIFSDPPGAHVYSKGGEYCGQTSEDTPVVRQLGSKDGSRSWNGGWVLKKRGYKPTTHDFSTTLDYDSPEGAAANRKKIVVVLDAE